MIYTRLKDYAKLKDLVSLTDEVKKNRMRYEDMIPYKMRMDEMED